jgi:hypothetical protein
MPFNPLVSRTLTVVSVYANAPATSGVYGIANAREWIYIGQSDNIQASLLNHLQERESVLMKKQPTGFVFELCDLAGRSARQDRLVFEYEPTCNRLPLNS